MQYLVSISVKWEDGNDRMTSVHFQGKSFNTTVIQVYAATTNAKEAEVEWFYEDLQDLLAVIPKKGCLFHRRGLECKSRRSRDIWSTRQAWPWCTKWSRTKANRVLPKECTGHSKHSYNNTRDNSTRGHHQIVNTKIRFIIFFAAKDGEALYHQQKKKKKDQELTVAQIMNSLLQNSDLNWRK